MIKPYKLGEKRKRSALAALILAVIAPGLGFLYCGQFRTALVLLASVVTTLLLVALLADPAAKGLFLLLYIAITILQVIASAVVAFRLGENYTLQRCNRTVVYVLFLMLFTAINYIDDNYLTKLVSINTTSMNPTLTAGDLVILDKFHYRMYDPAVGDVVYYRADSDSELAQVGRVTALGGDYLRLEKGCYFRNGQPLPQATVSDRMQNVSARRLIEMEEIILPEDEMFLAGDDLESAYDSRFTGAVSRDLIIGKVAAVVYSAEEHRPILGRTP